MMGKEVIVRVVELNLGRLRLMIFSESSPESGDEARCRYRGTYLGTAAT